MVKMRKGTKKVVVYEHDDGVIFIQPTHREANGRHKTKPDFIDYSNKKETDEELGRKVRKMLEKCN